jgi:hypothetical protein
MPQYQGIWSLQQQAQAQTNQQWVTDPYFKNTSLLLQADNAVNSGQNNAFYDSSNTSSLITRVGNTAQGSFSPYSPGWSIYFGGSGNYLSPAAGNEVYYPETTGAWTFETWIYPTSTTSGNFYGVGRNAQYGNSIACGYDVNAFTFAQGNGSSSNPVSITSSVSYPINNWYHYAVSKDGSNVIRLFINGVQVGTQTYSSTISTGNQPVINGVYDNNGLGNNGMSCYLSNLRWVKGGALYTSNFTPPTAPLSTTVSSGACFLLHAQSNLGVDNSQINNTFVPAGTPSVQPFSPFNNSFATIPATFSNSFDGANAYANVLTTAANANLILSTSDFTIESWIFPRILGSERAIISKWSNTVGNRAWVFELNSSNQPTFLYSTDGNGTITLSGTTAVVGNTWTHVAVSRSGNTGNIYVNGVLSGSNASFSPNIFAANRSNVNIGRYMNAAANIAVWNGLISNARVVKGTAVYTSNFTPSQAPLTRIANTSLLVCQSNNTTTDNGPSNFTITNQGNVRISSSVIPFAASYRDNPTYQTSTIGGSVYFDGSDRLSYLATGGLLGISSNNFTAEVWVYFTFITGSRQDIVQSTTASTLFEINKTTSNTIAGGIHGSTVVTSTTTVVPNRWYHIALVRSSTGTNGVSMYVNGRREAVGTSSTNITNGTSMNLGASSTDTNPFYGYMSGYRVLNGTALFPSSFDPPTSSPTPIANTALLINFADASIYDASMENTLETAGNVQVNTNIEKFGSGSMSFDGISSALNCLASPQYNFTTQDFTVEFWMYMNVTPTTDSAVITAGPSGAGSVRRGWRVRLHDGTTGALSFIYQTAGAANVLNFGQLPSPRVWHHIAFTRSNNTMRGFVDGVQNLGPFTVSDFAGLTLGTDYLGIGGYTNGVGIVGRDYFNGYLDDLRITNGIARYTSNFIPPKQALPRQ